jgi:hypothetical protein
MFKFGDLRIRAAIAAFALAISSTSSIAQPPIISLDWVGIYELTSCNPADQQRHLRAREEIERRLPEFRAIWANDGPLLLKTAEEVAGQPFRYREAIAVLQVCEDTGLGTSYPLMINPKWFLDAYEGKYRQHPLWRETFAELVFHEVLHRYIRDALGPGQGEPFRSSKLMQKYANEPLMTRTHLHLFAIERAVYRKLGRYEVVGMTREYTKNPAYVRAQHIVDDLGVDAVLADFKEASEQRRTGQANDPLLLNARR